MTVISMVWNWTEMWVSNVHLFNMRYLYYYPDTVVIAICSLCFLSGTSLCLLHTIEHDITGLIQDDFLLMTEMHSVYQCVVV